MGERSPFRNKLPRQPETKRVSTANEDMSLVADEEYRQMPEYKNYPDRHPVEANIRVVRRLEQFGVPLDLVTKHFGRTPEELTTEEIHEVMAAAVEANFHVLVGTVYNPDGYNVKGFQPLDYEHSPEARRDAFERMLDTARAYKKIAAHPGVRILGRGEEADTSQAYMALAIENGANVISGREDLDRALAEGLSIVGVQYNKESIWASGDGLTLLGVEMVKHLLDTGTVVDIAHATAKVREHVFRLAEDAGRGDLVSYTHGSTSADMTDYLNKVAPERAITQAEVERIVRNGGIVGLGATWPFFDRFDQIGERINDMAQLNGTVDSIVLGLDRGGVVNEWFFKGTAHPADLAMKLAEDLNRRFGFSNEAVAQILRTNIPAYLNRVVKP